MCTRTGSPPPLHDLRYLGRDDDSDTDNFVTPFAEETDPLLIAGTSHKRLAHVSPQLHSHEARITQPLRKSSSDLVLGVRARHRGSTADSVQTAFRVGDGEDNLTNDRSPAQKRTSHKPLWPAQLRRSSSNSGLELRSRFHDPALDSATLQQQLIMQVKHTGRRPLKPWRVRRVRTASGPFHWTNPQSPRPGFMWFAVRSKSDPSSIPQVAPKPGKLGKNLPLKSSMKRKAKSATTTPPSEIHTDSSTLTDEQKLRRVKTVDFEETTSKGLSSLPPLKLWSSEPTSDAADGEQRPRTRTPKAYVEPVKAAKRAPSCPGPMVKSSLADPAVTRTDVHVVAIAPSWSFDDTADEGGIDPATPTMQIVESKNGCYEVIWDDVPEEHDIRLHRRSSSASQALHTFGSTASRGLERVNTKLTEWTWGREGPTQPFKPQIVVFPDDDDRSPQPPQPDCAVDDSGDLVIVPPPNSAMTSTNPSRHTSRPVSTRTSREGSYDDPVQTAAPNINHPHDKRYSKIEPILRTSAIPDPDATMRTLTGVGRRVKGPPADRRLSNMDESEMRFRGHRDSVTIARTRMFDVGGISPELFMHRDSVAIAKKRMHGRSHAVSDVRDILRSKVKRSELLSTIEDVPQQSRSPSPIPAKEYATKALKSSGSASTLHLHAPTTQRHIRIAD